VRHSKFTHLPLSRTCFVLLICQDTLHLIISLTLLIMSPTNCPFSIFHRKESPETIQRKDHYISINIPMEPSDPPSQNITHDYNKLYSTKVEDILEFFSTFDDIVNTLSIPEGLQQSCLIPALMGNNA
jgi:hypothetical protein